MRNLFERELQGVTDQVIDMGKQVDKMLSDVINALQNKKIELAKEIVERDDVIDDIEHEIENMCIDIIATQCPIASDLRRITTILRMITDLERIADHCVNIAKVVIDNNGRAFMKPLVDLPKMQTICSGMISDSIESFIREDHLMALDVIKTDDSVDDLYESIYKELLEMLYAEKDKSEQIKEQVIMLLLIGRYLERIADHATNVAERVIYMVTGKVV